MQLTQGKEALVDDADYERVSQHRWCAVKSKHTYYAAGWIKGERVWLHRFLMGLRKGDKREIDHENHNGLDNQRHNLRVVTHRGNCQNRQCPGYEKRGDKFYGAIYVNRKRLHLGVWDDPRMARAMYLVAKQIYHPIGER